MVIHVLKHENGSLQSNQVREFNQACFDRPNLNCERWLISQWDGGALRWTNPERPLLSRTKASFASLLTVVTFTPSRLLAGRGAWQVSRIAHKNNGPGELAMAQRTSALVDYEPTSEEDNFSDVESADGTQSLPMRRWSSNTSLSSSTSDCSTSSSSEQSDFQLNERARPLDVPSPPQVVVVNSSTEEEAEREPTPHSGDRQEEDEISSCDSDSHTSGSQDDGVAEYDGTGPRSPELVDSSSEEEKPATTRPRVQPSSSRGAQGRGGYAMKFQQLRPELRELLFRSRTFFTKPHSLQRSSGPVTDSTYSKAQERILCKFLCCLSSPRWS